MIEILSEPAAPRFKKPRGRAPLADGVPCTWDGERGYWVTASGAHHDVAAVRKATTAEYFSAMKLPDAEVQEQRRSDCARVAGHCGGSAGALRLAARAASEGGDRQGRAARPTARGSRRLLRARRRTQAPCVLTAPRSEGVRADEAKARHCWVPCVVAQNSMRWGELVSR